MEYAKTMHQQADLAVMLASTAAGGGGVGGGGGLQEGLDPFKVENPSSMVLGGPADGSSSKGDDLLQFFARQAVIGGGGGAHRKSLDMGGMMGIGDEGTYKFRGDKDKAGHVMAWAPNMGPIEPSDTDSIEGSSVEASPPTRYAYCTTLIMYKIKLFQYSHTIYIQGLPSARRLSWVDIGFVCSTVCLGQCEFGRSS